MKLDWQLLREQKDWLLDMAENLTGVDDQAYVDGILSMMDALQDEAVENGDATELEVFGPANAACNHGTWDVYLNNVLMDTVHFQSNLDAAYVMDALINHDGYDSSIEVKQRPDAQVCKARSEP